MKRSINTAGVAPVRQPLSYQTIQNRMIVKRSTRSGEGFFSSLMCLCLQGKRSNN